MEKEKKKLKLKVRVPMPMDIHRWFSKKLHKIIKSFREKNENKNLEELAGDKKYKELIMYAVRESLVEKSDKQEKKKIEKIQSKYESKEKTVSYSNTKGENSEPNDKKEISDKKYQRKQEQLEYKKNKKLYANDLIDERPKNPRFARIAESLKNGAIKAGTIVKNGVIVIGGVVAFPFVMGAKGINKLYNSGKIKLLTAGKIYRQFKEVENVVRAADNANKEMKVAEKSKELDDEATIAKKLEIYNNSSPEVQTEIVNKAHGEALKEEAKRQREAKRRENLHMDSEPIQIEHEKTQTEDRQEENKDYLKETIENNETVEEFIKRTEEREEEK